MIKETKDYLMIRRMLTEDKELFERISDDYTDLDSWNPELSLWLGWFEDYECRALLSVKQETETVLIVHIHIPKKHRGERSFKYGNGLLKYLEKTCNKRFVKINAKIPVLYPDVVKYAEKNGFEKEGIDRKSYVKNGKHYDRVMLGKIIR